MFKHVYKRANTHIYARMHKNTGTCIPKRIYTRTHTCINTHTSVQTYTYIYLHISHSAIRRTVEDKRSMNYMHHRFVRWNGQKPASRTHPDLHPVSLAMGRAFVLIQVKRDPLYARHSLVSDRPPAISVSLGTVYHTGPPF